MIRAALAAGLVAGVLGAMVPPAGRAMTPHAVDPASVSAPNDAPAMTVVPDHGSAAESITLTVHFPYVSDRPNGACPGGPNPPAVLAWDGVRIQVLDMHGECDLATTITPLAGHTGPGVHRIDATLTLPDAPVLTAIGLYTVDAASTPASATASAPSGPGSGGRGLKYVAGIAAVLALIAIAVVARRRRPA